MSEDDYAEAAAAAVYAEMELDELRAERDEAVSDKIALLMDIESLEAERDAMRPVVEAATAWMEGRRVCPGLFGQRERSLGAAVDAYRG